MSQTCYDEDELLPISGLGQLIYCERRAALIHIEGLWEENVFTTEGAHMHEKVHEAGAELRGEVLTVRGLRMRSLRLGLTGQADVVEFHLDEARGVALAGRPGRWRPFPVEFKRGRPKRDPCDEVQLCAQALCLEEMLDCSIAEGALFYGQTRHRTPVAFGLELRRQTERAAERLHALFRSRQTPPARDEKKCETWSLRDLCRPRETSGARRVEQWLIRSIGEEA